MHLSFKPEHQEDPLWAKFRPLSEAFDQHLHNELTKMEQAGVIKICSDPRFTSPIHLVKYVDKPPRITVGTSTNPPLSCPQQEVRVNWALSQST